MSLGKDLAFLRKQKNLSLEDVQNAIKIPAQTLESIEDDSIFIEPTESKTYIRSFVRSYARYLKINDEDIVQALDAMEAGTYSGELVKKKEGSDTTESTGQPKKEESSYSGFSEKESDGDLFQSSTYPKGNEPEKSFDAVPEPVDPQDDIKDEHESASSHSQPLPEKRHEINWADMGRKFTMAENSQKSWMIGVTLFLIVLLSLLGYFFSGNISSIFSSDEPLTEETAGNDQSQETTQPFEPVPEEMAADSNQVTMQMGSQATIELGDTLTVAVYAAYGILDPVRVTSDFNWRTNPFWMEQGEAYYFDFNDTLLVRGQYSDIVLLFNGHVIENPRQNYFSERYNSIAITRSALQQPRYLAEPPEEFPLNVSPPDSIIYRISF